MPQLACERVAYSCDDHPHVRPGGGEGQRGGHTATVRGVLPDPGSKRW